jgi:hypothetical protein
MTDIVPNSEKRNTVFLAISVLPTKSNLGSQMLLVQTLQRHQLVVEYNKIFLIFLAFNVILTDQDD